MKNMLLIKTATGAYINTEYVSVFASLPTEQDLSKAEWAPCADSIKLTGAFKTKEESNIALQKIMQKVSDNIGHGIIVAEEVIKND